MRKIKLPAYLVPSRFLPPPPPVPGAHRQMTENPPMNSPEDESDRKPRVADPNRELPASSEKPATARKPVVAKPESETGGPRRSRMIPNEGNGGKRGQKRKASSSAVPASPPLSAKLAPSPTVSRQKESQGKNLQGTEIASPMISGLTTFDPRPKKQILRNQETHMHNDHSDQDTPDEVVMPSAPEALLEEPSSPEETKLVITRVSRLNSPPKPPKLKLSNLSQEHWNLVLPVVSNLLSELTNSSDVNRLISLANCTFSLLGFLEIDHLPLHRAVHALIFFQSNSFQSDKEGLEMQKRGSASAFSERNRHDEILTCLADAKVAQSTAHINFRNAQQKLVPLRAIVEKIREQLRKAEEEIAEVEAELAHSIAEKVQHEEAEVINMKPEMEKAQKVIDDVERRWKSVMSSIKQTTNELVFLNK